MSTPAIKKALVLSIIFLVIIYVPVSLYLADYLPSLLKEYLLYESQREMSDIEYWALLLSIPFICLNLASLIGLLFLKAWADKLFFYTFFIGSFIALFYTGPTVTHGFASAIECLYLVLTGMLLAVIVFPCSNNVPNTSR